MASVCRCSVLPPLASNCRFTDSYALPPDRFIRRWTAIPRSSTVVIPFTRHLEAQPRARTDLRLTRSRTRISLRKARTPTRGRRRADADAPTRHWLHHSRSAIPAEPPLDRLPRLGELAVYLRRAGEGVLCVFAGDESGRAVYVPSEMLALRPRHGGTSAWHEPSRWGSFMYSRIE